MDRSFELRRRPVAGALREYLLYGPDGACLLTARFKGTRMLPRLVELVDDRQVVARIVRKGLLGRRILLEDLSSGGLLRLNLPVMTSAARTRPFDLVDRRGRVAWRFAPLSGLADRSVLGSAMIGALFDSELVLLAGDAEIVGATAPSHDPAGPWPDGPAGLLQFLGRMRRQLARLTAEAMVRESGDGEVAVGRFDLTRADIQPGPTLIMLILLFRRFDYDFMRDIS